MVFRRVKRSLKRSFRHVAVQSTCVAAICALGVGVVSFERKAKAEEASQIYNHFGGVGLIRTRTARMGKDSTIASSVSWTSPQQRYSVSFQAAPWLETTFSYSLFDFGPIAGAAAGNSTADRQFDIKIRLMEEGPLLPEVAVGLQDFLGTGLFSGEYIVASKQLGPLDLSFGVGWGSLASRGGLENPLRLISDGFKTRERDFGQGGEVNFGQFLRGDSIGFFGGVSYQTPIRGLQLMAEYDSDNREVVDGMGDKPFNFGLTYNYSPGIQLNASYIGLDQLQLGATFSAAVGEWARDEPPGQPAPTFYVRDQNQDLEPLDGDFITPIQPMAFIDPGMSGAALGERLAQELSTQGLTLMRMTEGEKAIRVVIRNNRYRAAPKAVGRAVRILSGYAAPGVETFNVVIEQLGMETAEFAVDRSTVEASAREIGYGIAAPSLAFTYVTPGSEPVAGETIEFDRYPDFDWSFGPDIRFSFFDPSDPLRFQVDAELDASVEVSPGLLLSGNIAYGLFGNLDDQARGSDSVIQRVRSDANLYAQETDIGVYTLKGEYFFSPAPNVYAKVSGGLLEQMYAGVGGEVLYRPANSRFAYGAEAYAVKQRDFDTLFSFRDYETVTGHVSAYYSSDYNNWNVAVHAGRYLAEDWGATLELSRRFSNGWEVGAFATLTDVPFSQFGEGSFDKGLTFKIPFDWQVAGDSQSAGQLTLRPVQRDGGARLNPGNRLFRLTQPNALGDVATQWSNFAH